MSILKRVGRTKRRMDKMIDKMLPGKFYTLTFNGRSITRNGATWKKIKEAA